MRYAFVCVIAACSAAPDLSSPDARPDAGAPYVVSAPTVLAAIARPSRSVVADRDAVYWIERDATRADFAIRRYDLRSGETSTLAEPTGSPSQLMLLGDGLFWVDVRGDERSAIERTSTHGGGWFVVGALPGVYAVAGYGDHIYWVAAGGVWSARADGTERERLDDAGAPASAITADNGRVAWVAGDGTWWIDRFGAPRTKIADTTNGDVALDFETLYVVDRDAHRANAYAFPSGTTSELATSSPPARVVAAGGTAYVAEDGAIEAFTAGAPRTIAAARDAFAIALTPDAVFYAELPTPTDAGAIWAAPR
jgi:hypothetical protein